MRWGVEVMPNKQATSFRPDRAMILKKLFLFLFENMHAEDYELCVACQTTFFFEYYYKQVSLIVFYSEHLGNWQGLLLSKGASCRVSFSEYSALTALREPIL